jgi:hypothetical protein
MALDLPFAALDRAVGPFPCAYTDSARAFERADTDHPDGRFSNSFPPVEKIDYVWWGGAVAVTRDVAPTSKRTRRISERPILREPAANLARDPRLILLKTTFPPGAAWGRHALRNKSR